MWLEPPPYLGRVGIQPIMDHGGSTAPPGQVEKDKEMKGPGVFCLTRVPVFPHIMCFDIVRAMYPYR